MQGGKIIRDGWAYIGLNTNWEMGKHYTYTVDFSDGAGQDETGKQLISGKDIKLNVKVAKWNEKAIAYPSAITGTASGTFIYKVGGANGTRYTVTPDASGNWSSPVSNFNGVTDMDNIFSQQQQLTSLDLSGLNTSSVTNMSGMFAYCENLTSLDLSGLNTSSVTKMSNMFQRCSSLTSLDISHFDTSNVTSMNYVFSHCQNLTSLDLSHFDTSKVTSMYSMFAYCENLTSLDLSGWDTSNVTYMDIMFRGCSNLKTIRMVGCSEATINKIKAQLATDGITSCTIVTE